MAVTVAKRPNAMELCAFALTLAPEPNATEKSPAAIFPLEPGFPPIDTELLPVATAKSPIATEEPLLIA